MHIDQRVGQSIGWPGDDYLLPPLWSRNFGQISQQGIFMWFTEELVQRPKMLFPTVFLRDGIWLGEKNEMSITGSLGGVWRAAAVYAVQRMVERPQNDTRMVEHLGFIEIRIKCLKITYIYDSDILQWSACTYWIRIIIEKTIRWVRNSAPVITR